MRKLMLALASTIIADPAWALDPPKPGKADPWMETVAYASDQIYPITLEVGHTTAITVSDKEVITDIWGSDSANLKSDMSDHFAFLKAQHEFTPRSLYIRTRRDNGESRLYVFQVEAVPAGNDTDSYDLRFTYPLMSWPQSGRHGQRLPPSARSAWRRRNWPRHKPLIRQATIITCCKVWRPRTGTCCQPVRSMTMDQRHISCSPARCASR
jgi:hypothetical protein